MGLRERLVSTAIVGCGLDWWLSHLKILHRGLYRQHPVREVWPESFACRERHEQIATSGVSQLGIYSLTRRSEGI